MSLMSSEFGIMDYLRGHIPLFLNVNMSTEIASISFPANKEIDRLTETVINFPISTNISNDISLDQFTKEVNQNNNKFHSDELCTLFYIYRTTLGFQSDMNYRLRLTRLRLQCFFIIVHSKIPPGTIQEHLKNSSLFVKELIDTSDLSSEAISELNLDFPISLSYISLECVLGLLEIRLRRRNQVIFQFNILTLLGLAKNPDLEPQNSLANVFSTGAQDELWFSIVMSSCSALSLLLSPDADPNTFFISSPDVKYINLVGKFIRIGLELYALALSTRESNNVICDMPLISTIIGTIQSCESYFKGRIFDDKLSASDVQLVLVISKSFYCLDCTIERQGYFTAFRECDGLAPVTSILKLFALSDPTSFKINDYDYPLNYYLKSVLDTALSLLRNSIVKSRNAVMMQGSNAESGKLLFLLLFIYLL